MAEAEIAHTNQSTRTLLLGIWGHLSRRRRIQLGLLLVVMLASGGAELVSLGAVLPFLAALIRLVNLWLNGRLAAVGSSFRVDIAFMFENAATVRPVIAA